MSKFADRGRPANAKFPKKGATVSGTVLKVEEVDVKKFVGGLPTNESAGYTQIDVVIQTATGKQVLHTGGNMFDAIDAALDKAKLSDLVSGHKIAVTYVGDGDLNASGIPSKLYEASVQHA